MNTKQNWRPRATPRYEVKKRQHINIKKGDKLSNQIRKKAGEWYREGDDTIEGAHSEQND